jgi:3-deoxy-manno-octulosonate cytidylyltransferase (CMP-KDO synthetase)
MSNTAVIIPSRLKAERLPNKPLKLINKKEMILHVYEIAIKAKIGEVFVATPDREIADIIESHGGKATITNKNHQTGTDRIFEVFQKELKSEPEFIVNLQGDMPNLNPLAIYNLIEHMKKKTCDIGTLASELSNLELNDPNVVKVITSKNIEKEKEFSNALDFFRASKNSRTNSVYHHIGIYAFTNKALIRYVSLKRSKLEIERKLEQLRALENQMKIEVGYIKDCPLSVDTEKDLEEIKKIMQIK